MVLLTWQNAESNFNTQMVCAVQHWVEMAKIWRNPLESDFAANKLWLESIFKWSFWVGIISLRVWLWNFYSVSTWWPLIDFNRVFQKTFSLLLIWMNQLSCSEFRWKPRFNWQPVRSFFVTITMRDAMLYVKEICLEPIQLKYFGVKFDSSLEFDQSNQSWDQY